MATAFAPKVSQILMTPDPHYIPGYGGFCPRYKFTLGQTYGKLTSELLTSPEAAHPGRRLLLRRNHSPGDRDERPEKEERDCWGEKGPPLGHGSIPGYTGFIPRAQNYFAKTYSEVSKEARSEFARQLAGAAGGKQAWRGAAGASPTDTRPESNRLTAQYKAPRVAVSTAAAPYVSRCAVKPHGSPHALENSSPQKYFVPGFTGFVPRARYLIGARYPVITCRALAEFDRMLRERGPGSLGSSAEAQKDGDSLPPLAKTYPTDMGLLPHYKGYVPGYKFQFGHTYGHLTHNALGQSTLEKQMQDVLP